MKNRLKIAVVLVTTGMFSIANAGIVEDLLALPAIQSFLGRQTELQSALQKCGDGQFKQRNAQICQRAEEASRLARMPAELRAVKSYPNSATSLRELRLAVQSVSAKNSYLCVELVKADSSFKGQVELQQAAQEQQRMHQNRESMDR